MSVLLSYAFFLTGPSLGKIDVASIQFSIMNPANHKVKVYGTRNHLLPLRSKVPLHAGDEIRIPKGGGVKGTYGERELVLQGPCDWVAPPKRSIRIVGPRASDRLLGRTEMDGKGKKKLHQFTLLSNRAEKEHDLYVDERQCFSFSWVALPNIKTVSLTVTVGGVQLAPRVYRAHSKKTPHRDVNYEEDFSLGAQLRSKFAQESEKTPIHLYFKTDLGEVTKVDGYLLSKDQDRELDTLETRLRASFYYRNGFGDYTWFDALNAFLLTTEETEGISNAFWVVKAWSKMPQEPATRDAMKELCSSYGFRHF